MYDVGFAICDVIEPIGAKTVGDGQRRSRLKHKTGTGRLLPPVQPL